MENDEYKYKTYRCEWRLEFYRVDPYGKRQPNSVIKTWQFPRREGAVAKLDELVGTGEVEKTSWGGFRPTKFAYVDIGINYYEVEVAYG